MGWTVIGASQRKALLFAIWCNYEVISEVYLWGGVIPSNRCPLCNVETLQPAAWPLIQQGLAMISPRHTHTHTQWQHSAVE